MKIRFDFVTNSSSSSFVIFNVKNKELVKICERFSIPVRIDRNGISSLLQAEQSSLAGLTPDGQSIAEWFAKVLSARDVYRFYDKDFTEAVKYLYAHADAIDAQTESSEIAAASVVTDDDGSYIDVETRKKGTIESFSVDTYEWDYEKNGEALWEALQAMDTGLISRMRKVARENHLIRKQKDPWYKETSGDTIFDVVQRPVTLQGKTCCLTGDFAYGSKKMVEEYIAGKGGSVASSVNRSVDYVVVGSLGSSAWKNNNYGSKVENAMKLREQKTDIRIIKEQDLFADDPDGDDDGSNDKMQNSVSEGKASGKTTGSVKKTGSGNSTENNNSAPKTPTNRLLPADGKLYFSARVEVPNTNWTIGVPEGYEYSDDPKKNGSSNSRTLWNFKPRCSCKRR